jgi:hypothetical protein
MASLGALAVAGLIGLGAYLYVSTSTPEIEKQAISLDKTSLAPRDRIRVDVNGSYSDGEKKGISGVSSRIQEYIKVAGSFRDNADYTSASDALKKAKSLEPRNKAVQTEIQHTINACLAEKRQGTTNASCD